MKLGTWILACVVLLCRAGLAGEPAVPLCQPWEAEYAGQDATGAHVIALWQFSAGAETADSSGHGHGLTLHGAKGVAEGRFGGLSRMMRAALNRVVLCTSYGGRPQRISYSTTPRE